MILLERLTTYLLQYKTVALPDVGTFQLVVQPAWLDRSSELLHPPHPAVQFSQEVTLSQHQVNLLANELGYEEQNFREKLEALGNSIRKRLQSEPFVWRGVGVLEEDEGGIHFRTTQKLPGPVTAKRIIRENVQHSVLIGDRQMEVVPENETEATDLYASDAPEKRSWVVILGWVAVLLAVVFLLYHLYGQHWSPTASGLQQNIPGKEAAPLYK